MKKLTIILAAILICVCANAQIYIGGGLGLRPSRYGDGISLSISPDVAYRVTNSMVIGGQLSYSTGYNGLGITPYLRWHVTPIAKNLSLFLSASIPTVFQDDLISVSFRLRPGATLRVSENLWLMAYLGSFGYTTLVSNGETLSSGWVASFDRNSINIGFCVCL